MKKPMRRTRDSGDDVLDGLVDAREERVERLTRITKRARRDVERLIRF